MSGSRELHRIAVSGSSGTVGSALVRALGGEGREVVRIARSPARAGRGDIVWDMAHAPLDPRQLEGIDAVVHLAGEPLDKRWTAERKAEIRRSRVESTHALALAMADAARTHEHAPRVMVVASAIGIYGRDRGDELLDEESAPGADFLAEVARAWEGAAEPARAAGVRVVNPRFGLILSRTGGALARMLLPFRLGLGGRVGSGRQWWSWVGLDDVIGAIRFVLARDAISGPLNTVAPHPVRSAEFTDTLGRVLGRPTVTVLPTFALHLAFGEMADATLLASQRVVPRRLQDSGFTFRFPELAPALTHELASR
jgi:uncharacterized protein (TIGR01777 family)